MSNFRPTTLVAFAVLGGLLSLALLYQHHASAGTTGFVDMLCGGGAESGCEAVNKSEYSVILGVPVAALGMFFYCTLGVLLAATSRMGRRSRGFAIRVARAGLIIALGIDLILLGVQLIQIGQLCWMCISTYFVTVAMLLLIIRQGKDLSDDRGVKRVPENHGRRGLVAMMVGIVCVGAVVYSTDAALSVLYAPPQVRQLEEEAVAEYHRGAAVTIKTGGAPVMGNQNAPIRIVIFSDFLCPYCRQTALYFKKHMPVWKDRVSVTFLNYPLDRLCNPRIDKGTHPGACWAALGGLCAQDQGKFWEYHDSVFQNPPDNPTGQKMMEIAHGVGIDTTAMKACLTSREMRRRIQVQIDDARAIGVNGTPRIFINGKRVSKLAALPAILVSEGERLKITPLEDSHNW